MHVVCLQVSGAGSGGSPRESWRGIREDEVERRGRLNISHAKGDRVAAPAAKIAQLEETTHARTTLLGAGIPTDLPDH